MRIAMIPSAYRTIFFHAVGQRLEAEGHEVFWLSPNLRWANWLRQHGVDDKRILDLSRSGREWSGADASPDLDELMRLERAGGLPIHNIVIMDPLLVQRPPQLAVRYLAVSERLIRKFLRENQIRAVFGEQTWAFELLTGQVCKGLGIPHLMPHTVRFPDPRFTFFEGHREDSIVHIREPSTRDRDSAETEIEAFRAGRPRPSYMHVNRSVLRPNLTRIRTLLNHVIDLAGDPFDETSLRPWGLIVAHTRKVVRGAVHRRSRRFAIPDIPPKRPFVYFPLHVQPEASIDIKGSPFCNQVEIIRALARSLPLSHDLWVKEHPNALPTRSAAFYRELQGIPGVRLISPFVDGFQLIIQAELVVSVTGTAAYEAALLGRPAVTIAPVFFDRIVAVARFDPFQDSVHRLLFGPSPATPKPDADLRDFVAWLLAQSFPGVVGDAFWQPESMAPENLAKVATGFITVIDRIASRDAVDETGGTNSSPAAWRDRGIR